MKKYLLPLLLLAGITACDTPRASYKAGFDFSRIRSVKVETFSSVARQPNSGSVVANEFIRQLLARGLSVKTDDIGGPADVILTGSVNEFQPTRRYLINAQPEDGRHGGRHQDVVVQPPVEVGGSSVYDLGTGDIDGNRVAVSNATVGISAYLKDAATGEIIWSDAFSYEGLDLTTALDGAVHYLLSSLPAHR
jgi:hypothetical protein